jgi:hypothetical protein
MVHGDCSSRGCYAMTDEQIQEIYALARESFFGGQKSFQLAAFPFRMTAMNMARHRDNPNFAFWKMIKEGYDHFEATHQEPKVAVCERRYVFDAVAPGNASRPLTFNARGACPAFQLDPTIATAVLEQRRQEQYQMAQLIAHAIAVVPRRTGSDGGMNPVFEAKLRARNQFDNQGHVLAVSGSDAPGALPRESNPLSGTGIPQPRRQPTVVASVPKPQAAPQPKDVETPPPQQTSTAGLFGNLFGSPQPQAEPAAPATEVEPVALRGANTEMAAKPKRAAPVRTASAPAVSHPTPREAALPKPEAVTNNAPAPALPVQQVRDDQKTPAPAPAVQQAQHDQKTPAATPEPARELRTAYSAPPASNNGLLTGAQPVVPASSFESRWTALR